MIPEHFSSESGRTYTPVRELGRGGFGVVYLAEDEAHERVALKVIAPVDDPQLVASFEQELRSTSGLAHPNLLKVIDWGEATVDGAKGLFAISEYCSGGDYRRKLPAIAGQRDKLDAIQDHFRQILSGLSALHTRVIHRDLKPENILISGDVLKIGDYGLARFVELATRTNTFKGAGTPLYMAPEVWLNERADAATDLYAIGVMLHEALTGQWPFRGDAYALREMHLHTPAPRPKSIQPWVPPFLDGIVKKLLAKDRGDRYQSADEVLSALTEGPPSADTRVMNMAGQVRQRFDRLEAAELDQQRAAERVDETEARVRYKEQELLLLADEVAADVNAQVPETRIEVETTASAREYQFAGRTLSIRFFRPGQMYRDPMASGRTDILRQRHVVHGGIVEITEAGKNRQGWNIVLLNPPERMYGDWRLIETRYVPAARPVDACEPFATEAKLLADNLARHWASIAVAQAYVLTEHALDRQRIANIFDLFVASA